MNQIHGDTPLSQSPAQSPYASLCILPPAVAEETLVQSFLSTPTLSADERVEAEAIAKELIAAARAPGGLKMMERLMAAFSLSRSEGRALMELGEAFLRIPDATNRDALIADKLVGRNWNVEKAQGLVRIAATALSTVGAIYTPHPHAPLRTLAQRLARPFVRFGVWGSMRMMAGQFVLAPAIKTALRKTQNAPQTLYSFDMLGEAARTHADEALYLQSYSSAITAVGTAAQHPNPQDNDGVSIKLSALSCRYQTRQWPELRSSLYPAVLQLAIQARAANIALTIDAEEAARLELSLALVRDLMHAPELAGWDGLGVVVQAYGLQAGPAIDFLGTLSEQTGRKLAVRLVKGAYWDAEIKIAQEKGLTTFPVYTRKVHTDLAYLHHARQLLRMADHLYPQFATHNAATLAAVEVMARAQNVDDFEIQRLHGMGITVHQAHQSRNGRKSRVYAPIGIHDDLLAYLVRRLLENGANASFLNKLSDLDADVDALSQTPYAQIEQQQELAPLRTGDALFAPERINSRGWDIDNPFVLTRYALAPSPLPLPPADNTFAQADAAFAAAQGSCKGWAAQRGTERALVLERIADQLEDQAPALFALLAQEAGKTLDDAIAEVREAVDFCRYYATGARTLDDTCRPRGVVLAISPWNFPLAIFTGQVVAALAAGNAVIAKPAEQTPRIAALAVELMHTAGVPTDVLQLLCGPGETLGAYLTRSGVADMVVFTGSTETARRIGDAIAASSCPGAPLLAETGGLNAMIVDSSALLERAVDDIINSAFRSAGQRCSALRMLYVQDDIYDALLDMLTGAAKALVLGDPVDFAVDVGPVIDAQAKAEIDKHVAAARAEGRLCWQGSEPPGVFCAPAIIELAGIADLEREIFGPVLHIARYRAGDEGRVIDAINASGYGLTFAMHSRIAQRYVACAAASHAGNTYINRNQIGAIVGSQPFGGHGLSGTGPKAGGPLYLGAFTVDHLPQIDDAMKLGLSMPGPDGEENIYRVASRGRVLCLDHRAGQRNKLASRAEAAGNTAVQAATLPEALEGFAAVMIAPDSTVDLVKLRELMAQTPGPLMPLIADRGAMAWLYAETHRCTDLTACGGNAQLLSRAG